jgi:cytochrome b561
MPYRERMAWLALIAMVVAYGPYFAMIEAGYLPGRALPDLRQLGLIALVSIVRLLILGIGYLYIRHGSPQEARTPPDERDRAIHSNSINSAYYVLMFGMVVVGCFMPFNSTGGTILNAALFMIVAAEIVRYGVAVASYRRQA